MQIKEGWINCFIDHSASEECYKAYYCVCQRLIVLPSILAADLSKEFHLCAVFILSYIVDRFRRIWWLLLAPIFYDSLMDLNIPELDGLLFICFVLFHFVSILPPKNIVSDWKKGKMPRERPTLFGNLHYLLVISFLNF